MVNSAILVTGAAGFIGFHVARQLLAEGREVVGLDNLNSYYDPALKHSRLDVLQQDSRFSFIRADLTDRPAIAAVFAKHRFEVVLHLAAQAGVRHSIEQPQSYVDSNLQGFVNILEECRHHGCRHLIYASSSSVYGSNTRLPFSVRDRTDHPVSLYAATKRANELMAHSYSHLYDLPVTGLRFFTVYGPWGRPDMAIFLFTKAIVEGRPIKLFNHGKMRRDFTFVDDVSQAVVRLIDRPPERRPDWDGNHPDPSTSAAPWRIYNIGNNRPEQLLHVVELLEEHLGRKAAKEMLPMQPGDVEATYADVADLERDIGFRPSTPIETGIASFAKWYREYHGM
jgi:UDP-glucuronate 4-epimerase